MTQDYHSETGAIDTDTTRFLKVFLSCKGLKQDNIALIKIGRLEFQITPTNTGKQGMKMLSCAMSLAMSWNIYQFAAKSFKESHFSHETD